MSHLKKHGFILFVLLISLVFVSWSQIENKQLENKKIIKLTYTSSPISQYRMTESDIRSTPTRASIYDYMKGITDYYSLYINLENRSSIYVLDSTVQLRPMGWENPGMNVTLMDSVFFTIKNT